MKIKTLIFSLLILASVAAVGFWLSNRDTGKPEISSRVGKKLVDPELLANISEIVLQSIADDKTVYIKKDGKGTWVLPDYYLLPVEFSKLDSFISSLLKADILRFVTRTKERMERLEFSKHKIVLKSNEETVWSMDTGKRGQSGGLFVRFNDEAEAYLADLTSYFDSNVDNWPEKRMLLFQSSDVAALYFEFPNSEPGFIIKRETAESEFTAEGLMENEKLNESAITSFISTLSSARYTEVHELDDPDAIAAKDNTHAIKFELFNDKTYSLNVGRRPAEIADAVESDNSELSDNESEDEVEPEEPEPGPVFIFFESSDPNDRLNSIMQRVSLSYSNYVFNQVPESREKFIEATPPSL